MRSRAAYRRLFSKAGRRVTLLRRDTGDRHDEVRARVKDFTPEEIASGIDAGSRRILILAEDVPASWGRLQASDAVIVDGVTIGFTSRPDDQTHRDGKVLLAYECMSSGA